MEHFRIKNELYMLSFFNINKTNLIRFLPILALLAFTACKNGESVFSRNNKSSRPSPPASTFGKIGETDIKITYSSPRVKDREIWGSLVPYDRIWRTGANEATTISVSTDVSINGEILPKGKYSLFTIPQKDQWIVIINEDWDLWGSYDYKERKDIMRITVIPYQLEKNKENMAFEITENSILFKWAKLGFKMPVLIP